MPTLHVVTRVSAHPDDVDAMKATLLEMAGPTRTSPGCLRWDVCQDCHSPNVFVIVGEWESPEALVAHRHSDHILGGFAKMAPMKKNLSATKMMMPAKMITRYTVEATAYTGNQRRSPSVRATLVARLTP